MAVYILAFFGFSLQFCDGENMNKFNVIIPLMLGLCLLGQTSRAETHYITDTFKTGLRTGPSLKNKIIRFLPSGQPVEALESQEGWTHVRVLREGAKEMEEGWVLARYLITRLPWKDVVAPLKEKNIALKEKLERTEKKCNEISQNERRMEEILEQKTDALQQLQQAYETLKKGSEDFLKLKEEQKYTKRLLETERQMKEMLINENQKLSVSERNNWLALGGLILLCGLMIGIAVGKARKKTSFH